VLGRTGIGHLASTAGNQALAGGSRWVLTVGLLTIAVGFAGMMLWSGTSPYLLLAVTLALIGAGVGLVGPPVASAYMNSLPVSQAGMASGIHDLVKDLGGALGTAVFGVVFSLQYTRYFDASVTGDPASDSVLRQLGGVLQRGADRGGILLVRRRYPHQTDEASFFAQVGQDVPESIVGPA